MEILFLAVLIGLIPAMIASSKGRSFVVWWLYGAAVFIIALPHSLLIRPNRQAADARQIADGLRKMSLLRRDDPPRSYRLPILRP